MINVSFNELAVTSELPAPRSTPRPADVSAFSKMLDKADTRPDLPANPDSRDSRVETRDEPTERASAPDAPRQDDQAPREVSSQEDMSKRPAAVAESDNGDSPARSSSDEGTKDIPQKADEPDTADKPLNDDKQQAASTPAAVPLIVPPIILAAATPNFGLADTVPVVTPIAAGDIAPSPQDEGAVVPQPLSGLRAPTAIAPNTLPGASPSDETDRSTAVSPSTPEAAAPSIPAAAAGKVMPETLFAVTALAQEVMPEPEGVTLPAAATPAVPMLQPQTGLRKVPLNNAILPQPTEPNLSEAAPPLDMAPQDLPMARPDVTTSASKPAASPTPAQPAKDLTALLALNGGEITFTQAPALSQANPAPLANGMVSQIGAAMSTEGQAKVVSASDSSTVAVSDIAATPNVSFAQTAMAVAGATMPQPADDEPQPKLTATADGLAINSPGQIGRAHV